MEGRASDKRAMTRLEAMNVGAQLQREDKLKQEFEKRIADLEAKVKALEAKQKPNKEK